MATTLSGDQNDKGRIIALHIGLLVLYVALSWVYVTKVVAGPGNEVFVPPGGDCVGIWLAGQLVMDGQVDVVYDRPAYYAFQQEVFGVQNVEPRFFPYPPFFLAVLPLFGLMPLALCCFTWFVMTFSALLGGVRSWDRKGAGMTLLLALSPAAFANLLAGQNGFLTAGLFVGGLGLLKRRPVMAGILFGFLTFKPHLGVLIPVALLLQKEWKAFAFAALTTVVLWGGSILLFGFDTMQVFFEGGAEHQKMVLEQWTGLLQLMMPTAFMAVRLLEMPFWIGYALSALFGLASLVAVALVWRRCGNHELRSAVLLCAAVTALPYIYNYDMMLTSVAVILLYPYVKDKAGRVALALLWLLPVMVFFFNGAGVPLGPLVLAFGLYVAVRTALSSPATEKNIA